MKIRVPALIEKSGGEWRKTYLQVGDRLIITEGNKGFLVRFCRGTTPIVVGKPRLTTQRIEKFVSIPLNGGHLKQIAYLILDILDREIAHEYQTATEQVFVFG